MASRQQMESGVFFGTGQWTRTYIRTVYCTCTQFNGHFSSCPLENLTRAFGEKFYRSDALPGTNHQKYTGLGSPWNWVSAHGVKKARVMGLPGRTRSLAIYSAMWIQSTNVTDRQMDTRRQQRQHLRIYSVMWVKTDVYRNLWIVFYDNLPICC